MHTEIHACILCAASKLDSLAMKLQQGRLRTLYKKIEKKHPSNPSGNKRLKKVGLF